MWLRSITSTEETGDSVDFCADQFHTSTTSRPSFWGKPRAFDRPCAKGVGNLTIAWVV